MFSTFRPGCPRYYCGPSKKDAGSSSVCEIESGAIEEVITRAVAPEFDDLLVQIFPTVLSGHQEQCPKVCAKLVEWFTTVLESLGSSQSVLTTISELSQSDAQVAWNLLPRHAVALRLQVTDSFHYEATLAYPDGWEKCSTSEPDGSEAPGRNAVPSKVTVERVGLPSPPAATSDANTEHAPATAQKFMKTFEETLTKVQDAATKDSPGNKLHFTPSYIRAVVELTGELSVAPSGKESDAAFSKFEPKGGTTDVGRHTGTQLKFTCWPTVVAAFCAGLKTDQEVDPVEAYLLVLVAEGLLLLSHARSGRGFGRKNNHNRGGGGNNTTRDMTGHQVQYPSVKDGSVLHSLMKSIPALPRYIDGNGNVDPNQHYSTEMLHWDQYQRAANLGPSNARYMADFVNLNTNDQQLCFEGGLKPTAAVRAPETTQQFHTRSDLQQCFEVWVSKSLKFPDFFKSKVFLALSDAIAESLKVRPVESCHSFAEAILTKTGQAVELKAFKPLEYFNFGKANPPKELPSQLLFACSGEFARDIETLCTKQWLDLSQHQPKRWLDAADDVVFSFPFTLEHVPYLDRGSDLAC